MPDNLMQKHEETYNAIISFYNLAENLIDSVESQDVTDHVSQLDFIEPIVKQLEESTDILSEEYRNFVETGKKPSFLVKKKIENAIKNLNNSLEICKKNLEKKD